MKDLVATLRREAERLGTAGIVGIALLVFAVMFALSALLPMREHAAQLGEDAADLQRKLKAGDLAKTGRPGVSDQLATFYAFFPAPDSSPDWLGRIHAIAQKRGVQLVSGEYRVERAPSARLARYQITLPVQGTYAQIRGFVGEVLEQVPAAVLEEFSVKRDNVESPKLEARVRLTLYLGSA